MTDLMIPMLIHIGWTTLLYALVSLFRVPRVWGVWLSNDGSDPMAGLEQRASANLSNQFEWPLFFYIACVILLTNPDLHSVVYIWLAWLFVVGRVIHSAVQILSTNIRLRGMVFCVNFIAVLIMWGMLGANLLSR